MSIERSLGDDKGEGIEVASKIQGKGVQGL